MLWTRLRAVSILYKRCTLFYAIGEGRECLRHTKLCDVCVCIVCVCVCVCVCIVFTYMRTKFMCVRTHTHTCITFDVVDWVIFSSRAERLRNMDTGRDQAHSQKSVS